MNNANEEGAEGRGETGDTAQLVEPWTEKPGIILSQVQLPHKERGQSAQSPLSVQTLQQCPSIPGVWSHVSIFVCTLKIPNISSYTAVWAPKSTAHTGRNFCISKF